MNISNIDSSQICDSGLAEGQVGLLHQEKLFQVCVYHAVSSSPLCPLHGEIITKKEFAKYKPLWFCCFQESLRIKTTLTLFFPDSFLHSQSTSASLQWPLRWGITRSTNWHGSFPSSTMLKSATSFNLFILAGSTTQIWNKSGKKSISTLM